MVKADFRAKTPMDPEPFNLKESNEFLNLLLDNIDAAILIADENLQIHQFNKSFYNLFDRAANRSIDSTLGQMSDCVNAIEENKSCGETSKCQFCVLRTSLLQTFVENLPADRKRLERIFYIDGKPVFKYLEFSSKVIRYRDRKMVLIIRYDMTEIERQKRDLEILKHHGPVMGTGLDNPFEQEEQLPLFTLSLDDRLNTFKYFF